MRFSVASILLVGGVLSGMITHDHPVPREFLSSLMENIKIDWGKPPTNDMIMITEKTCGMWFWKCAETKFKVKKTMVRKFPQTPGSWRLMESTPDVKAYFIPRVERGVMNMGEDDIFFSADESTSTVDSNTEGWQIGAQIFGGLGSAGVSVSAANSKSWSAGKSLTKGVSIQTTCRAGYDCRIETWTFHLRVTGYCQLRPVIDCDGEINACRTDWGQECDQFDHFRHRHCLTCDSASPFFHEKCQVQTPILDQAGRPFSRLVRISERIASLGSEGESRRPVAAKAVKFEDGIYQLESGEWYDDKDDTYYGNLDDKWYHKPDVPKPDLTLGATVRRSCKTVPCYREFERLMGGRKMLPEKCRHLHSVPDVSYRADILVFPFQPTCGRMHSLLRLHPNDFRSVCSCIDEERDGGQSCPDCKTSVCYRELIHLHGGSIDALKRQCRNGDLSKAESKNFDLPEFPFESICGQVITFANFKAADFRPVCDCIEANEAIRHSKATSPAHSRREIDGHEDQDMNTESKKPPRSNKKKALWMGGGDIEVEFLDQPPVLNGR
ncbi:hypothetical protein XA68_13439 [Ophiocordyceps unilateralis]|uniref:Cyanovirin-N domain-containing protein n=1 Tax=Ophiocordyceps unilateralis TaxID=268505 RepID=A0A2A9PCI2_OPHUN|nr:hypothetical protein XA68_13439 [Ophiocordyceps unilateralis]